ncbi:UNVERIFIED_CONTAM: hypothetical protein Sindi_0596900 [Sesamum indicum]
MLVFVKIERAAEGTNDRLKLPRHQLPGSPKSVRGAGIAEGKEKPPKRGAGRAQRGPADWPNPYLTTELNGVSCRRHERFSAKLCSFTSSPSSSALLAGSRERLYQINFDGALLEGKIFLGLMMVARNSGGVCWHGTHSIWSVEDQQF